MQIKVGGDPGTLESASGVHLPDLLYPSRSWIDSGAVDGVIPGYLNPPEGGGAVVPGTTMSVFAPDGTLLYMTPVAQHQIVSGVEDFNTGVIPFTNEPISISYSPYGSGTTVFDT